MERCSTSHLCGNDKMTCWLLRVILCQAIRPLSRQARHLAFLPDQAYTSPDASPNTGTHLRHRITK